MEQLNVQLSDARSIELDNAFYVEDGEWIESLTISAACEFNMSDLVDSIPGTELLYTRDVPTGPTGTTVRRVTILANESYPFILGLILRNEAIPNRVVLNKGEFDVVITAQNWDLFRSLADEIQASLGRFELMSVSQIEDPGEPLDGGRLSEVLITKLADEQLAVLETAYEMGYFDVPRQACAHEVANELEIAQSTLSERLRTAERNLLELVYGPRCE